MSAGLDKEIIIITGGNGFIGKTLIGQLKDNYRLISIDRDRSDTNIPAREIICDMGSAESIESALGEIEKEFGTKIACVIHLAAYYDFAGKPSQLYDQITVKGTKNLLKNLQKFSVDQFIFSSSLLVYAPSKPGKKINEDWELEPKWDYPESKVKAEEMIRKHKGNIPAVVLRIAGVYSDKGNSIPIANHIQRIYEKQLTSHFFPGDASHGNPFLHIADLCDVIKKTINKKKELPANCVLNIGEPETLSYQYLQNTIGKLIHGKEWSTYRIPKFLAKIGATVQDIFGDPFIKAWMIDMADDHMELDISKAKKLIDWQPKHSLKETLPKIIDALKEDPKKWHKENKLKYSRARTNETELIEEKKERKLKHEIHHQKTTWMHFINFFLGLWLITGALSNDYHHNTNLFISDIVCGILICILSLISTHPYRLWAPWGAAITGLWLNVAPLLFWAPTAVLYNNDVFVGILVIVFAFIAPGAPGAKLYEKPGPDIPPGWTVNPSSWVQRAPIIFLGWIGFFSSKYLASYQLGYIPTAWDPFFGKGTENVLNSDVSKAWPVSDAGLGAFSYMLDALMAYIGGENRWRTMPWVVIIFGILIIPLGAVSIGLIILQPLAVGSWCSICLFTAIVMLIMIPCTFDEVFASLEVLKKSRREGRSVWKAFWFGDSFSEKSMVYIPHNFSAPFHKTLRAIFKGFLIPWNLLLTAFIGVWIMLSSSVLKYTSSLTDSDGVTGALVVTFSVIAMGEVVRAVRFINILAGIWIIVAVFVFGIPSTAALINAIICGALLIVLSFRKGKVEHQYGSFQKYIV